MNHMAVSLELISALVLLLIVFPIIGFLMYKIENNKIVALIFVISAVTVTLVVYFTASERSLAFLETHIVNYFNGLVHFEAIVIITLIGFLFAGSGFVGGALEFIGEKAESNLQERRVKSIATFKLYFLFMLYGYLVCYSIYSVSHVFSILLSYQHDPTKYGVILNLITYLQFNGYLPMLLGVLFFMIKTFRYGIFSLEYFKPDYEKYQEELGRFRLEFHHICAIVFGVLSFFAIGLQLILNLYPIENFNPAYTGTDVVYGAFFYYLIVSITAFIFFLFRDRFVYQRQIFTQVKRVTPQKRQSIVKTPTQTSSPFEAAPQNLFEEAKPETSEEEDKEREKAFYGEKE
jgi:hypothetical protein